MKRRRVQTLYLYILLSFYIFARDAVADQIQTDCLFVFFDAGETNGLLPVLNARNEAGKDFRVLVMGTAETLITPEMFPGKRLVLADLSIKQHFDKQTPRTVPLADEEVNKLTLIQPKIVLTGTVSRIQQQVLEYYSQSTTVAFLDSFSYDPKAEFFGTVVKVQAAAKQILCPSKNVAEMFSKENTADLSLVSHSYHVVGKPSIQAWQQQISMVNRQHVFEALGLTSNGGKIVSFLGGYGQGYDVINPLFERCAAQLQQEGYQIVIEPHPKIAPQKVAITDVLAVADYVVGYNSSVVFDAALIGKNALYLIPTEIPYQHFAIEQGLISQVANCDALLAYIRSGKTPGNIQAALNIPLDSVKVINELLDEWISLSKSKKTILEQVKEQKINDCVLKNY